MCSRHCVMCPHLRENDASSFPSPPPPPGATGKPEARGLGVLQRISWCGDLRSVISCPHPHENPWGGSRRSCAFHRRNSEAPRGPGMMYPLGHVAITPAQNPKASGIPGPDSVGEVPEPRVGAGGEGAPARASPLTLGCTDGVPGGRVQSGPGCGSSHLGRGSWGQEETVSEGPSSPPAPGITKTPALTTSTVSRAPQ